MSIRLTDFLERAARFWPDRTAITFGTRVFTWSEYARRCASLAGAMEARGLQRGDNVVYIGDNSNICLECYFAPAFAGAAFTPINTRLSRQEMLECIQDCTPKFLIVDKRYAEFTHNLSSDAKVIYAGPGEPPSGMLSYESLIAAGNAPKGEPGANDDTAIMFYTGGTTGRAKGVMLTHTNIFANVIGAAANFGYDDETKILICGPLFHGAAGIRVYMSTAHGAHAVVLPKFEILEVLATIDRHRISMAQLVPTMMTMLLDHPDLSRYDLTSLRNVSYGAAPMPHSLLKRTMAYFPNVKFTQTYGMTEVSPTVSNLRPEHHALNGPLADKLSSVGKPALHVDVRIVDIKGADTPQGEAGEIIVRGPNVMKGYWKLPRETAEALRDGWYYTGDAGYFDEDGFLFIAGRIKDMIVSGGENVYPIETENVLSLHPDICECAVIGVPHPLWGEAVHAVVVLNKDACATQEDLIAHCRENLAHYKCPRAVTIRQHPMPLSTVNKIMKSQLRKEIIEGASQ